MSPGRATVVVLGALTLQVCLFSRFSFDGARPDVMVLVAVLAGLLAGPDRGAILGFASGLAFDVVLTTPFGLSALIYTIVGYGVGTLSGGMVRSSRWLVPAVAAVGSAVAMLLYALVGVVVGEATLDGPPLAAIVVYVAAVNAACSPLAARAVRWVVDEDRDHHRRPSFLTR
ncbi:MAG: rod shape-determining protein MreD [Acidimicrobiales bacterium]|nr:rod shape-determining protein MreD [Acidimicrobiales bacterium]